MINTMIVISVKKIQRHVKKDLLESCGVIEYF